MDVRHDLHVHTCLSACSPDKANQPAAILSRAESLGFRTIGFSDHLWMNPDVEPNGWYRPQNAGQIDRLRDGLRSVVTSTRLLVGCEADTVAPGRFSITPQFAAGLDYVNLACSHFHIRDLVEQPRDDTPRALAEHLCAFFVSAAECGWATVIVHPFLPIGHGPIFDRAIATLSDSELEDTLARAAARHVALEITPSFLPPAASGTVAGRLWSLETPLRILALARSAGCRFVFGSDSHALDTLGRVRAIEEAVRPLGLTAADMAPIVKEDVG